jgi:hypothetical protein
MTRDDVEELARRKPFCPFLVRLVDGTRHRFKSSEEFVVTDGAIHALDRSRGDLLIGLVAIVTIRVEASREVDADEIAPSGGGM